MSAKILLNKHKFALTAFCRKCGVDATHRSSSSTPVSRGLDNLGSSSGSLRLGLLLLLLLDLIRIAVEEHVDHDVPAFRRAGDRSTETEDFPCKQPPHETNRVPGLVVGGDDDVDELERRIGVAEGNDGDVDVRRLADGLVVNTRVGDDDQPGLLERAGDVVGEATGGEATGDGLCTGVGSVFQHGAVAVRAGGDDTDIVRVLDGGNDPGCEDEFLPGLANVENVDTWRVKGHARTRFSQATRLHTVVSPLPDVRFHLLVAVLRAYVALRGQQELDLLIGGSEDGG